MYLSAERIAVANKAVQETFEQTSIAWQAIPHWDTGDPGQFRVRSDNAYAPPESTDDMLAPPIAPGDSLKLDPVSVRFALTVAQAIAPTPDAILAAVIARTVQLAGKVDCTVIEKLLSDAQGKITTAWDIPTLLPALIDARADLEKSGYRSPSCLLTDTTGLKALNTLQDGLPVYQPVLDAANINSLYRFDEFDGQNKGRMLLLGRRQRVAHGGAASVSPGEEPVDLAVSVPPSLEVVGETDNGYIELAVRIRFATRVADKYGVVGVDQS
jgi:hypothetical protein